MKAPSYRSHDADDREPARGAEPAAGLALKNERLNAELRATVK